MPVKDYEDTGSDAQYMQKTHSCSHKPYTINDLEMDCSLIMQELAAVRKAKGHDYSGEEDTLDNLRDFGWRGAVVRMGDKYKRLKHFCQQGHLKVTDESIEDTMKDMINYALFCLILYRQEAK